MSTENPNIPDVQEAIETAANATPPTHPQRLERLYTETEEMRVESAQQRLAKLPADHWLRRLG